MNRTRTFTVLKGIALPWIFPLVLVGNFIEPLFANEVSFDVKLLDLKLDVLAVEGVLEEFFDVDEPSQSQPVAQSTGNFSANIKEKYDTKVKFVQPSTILRVGGEIPYQLNQWQTLNLGLNIGAGSSKYSFPNGISVFTDPAVLETKFLEASASVSVSSYLNITKKLETNLDIGLEAVLVNVKTTLTSALLNVRSRETDSFYRDYLRFGFSYGQIYKFSPQLVITNFTGPKRSGYAMISLSTEF